MKKKQMINLAKDALAAIHLVKDFRNTGYEGLAKEYEELAEKSIIKIIKSGLVKNYKEGEKLKQE